MNRSLILAIILLPFITPLCAQDITSLLKEARAQENAMDEEGAYQTFRKVLKADAINFEALWKCSELCSRMAKRSADHKQQLDYLEAARIYAETSIRVKPEQADGYYAMSVAMGQKALVSSGKDRVNAVRGIRLNALKAISLNPDHGRAWHVLGRWNYEVSNLNGMERTALRIIYGGLPPASFEEAIADYEKAAALEPDFALNYLELAKAYHESGNDKKATETLRRLATIPAKTKDDPAIQAEGKMLLKKLS